MLLAHALALRHSTSICHTSLLTAIPPYPPDSQAAAEEERLRKKAEEDQAKEQVCLGTYPDVNLHPLHSQPLYILLYVRRSFVALLQVLVFGFT